MKGPLQWLAAYMRREKIISAMLFFMIALIAFSAYIHMGTARVPDEKQIASKEARQETASELKRIGEKLTEELRQNSPALIKLTLAFCLFLMTGLFIDAVCLAAWRDGKVRFLPALSSVSWFAGDAFKGFVVLFFWEAVFSILFMLGTARGLDMGLDDNTMIMLTTFVRNIIVGIYIFILVKRRYGATASDLGFRFGRPVRNVLTGLAAYTGFFPIYFTMLLMIMGIVHLTGWEPPVQSVVDIVYREKNLAKLFAFGVFIAFVGPVFEEMFFRGFVYQAFRKKWGVLGGMAVTSIVFAVLHAHWVALLPIFALSMVLCWTFEITGSLVPGMVLHMMHNMVTLAIMFQIKGFE